MLLYCDVVCVCARVRVRVRVLLFLLIHQIKSEIKTLKRVAAILCVGYTSKLRTKIAKSLPW